MDLGWRLSGLPGGTGLRYCVLFRDLDDLGHVLFSARPNSSERDLI